MSLSFVMVIVIIAWGIWAFCEKKALQYASPWQTLFVFYVWTAILFLPFVKIVIWKKYGGGGFRISHYTWQWILFAVISDLIAVLGIRFALLRETAGIVIALASTYPIITTFLSYIFLKEKITKTQFAGILITCSGIVLLSL